MGQYFSSVACQQRQQIIFLFGKLQFFFLQSNNAGSVINAELLALERGFLNMAAFQLINTCKRADTAAYLDWSAGVSYDWQKLNFAVTYTDTDIDTDCSSLCDGRVVGAITYSF